MSITQIRGTQIKDNTVTSGQVDSTIVIASGANAFTGDQSLGSHKITNLATCTSPTDAANKAYVDLVSQGLNQKATARVALTTALAACTYNNGAGTLTGNANNTQLTIDGVTLAVADVLLIMGQASAFQNGLYTVTQIATAGLPFIFTRHTNMDTSAEVAGAFVPVDQEGTANKNTLWLANYIAGFVLGTNDITFVQLNSSTSYTGSNGISVAGSVISPTYGTTANTVAQGNDSRITGAIQTAKYITRETPSGSVNGSNTAFVLANTPVSGSESVYENGILQEPGAGNDYTISGATITYLTAPISGDRIRVSYISQ